MRAVLINFVETPISRFYLLLKFGMVLCYDGLYWIFLKNKSESHLPFKKRNFLSQSNFFDKSRKPEGLNFAWCFMIVSFGVFSKINMRSPLPVRFVTSGRFFQAWATSSAIGGRGQIMGWDGGLRRKDQNDLGWIYEVVPASWRRGPGRCPSCTTFWRYSRWWSSGGFLCLIVGIRSTCPSLLVVTEVE